MSREDVEIVRTVIDHYNQTGEPPWDLIDPDVEWVVEPPAWVAATYETSFVGNRAGDWFITARYAGTDQYQPSQTQPCNINSG
jgi:hypothetical protein